jgi:hypothetical protein
MSMRSLVEQIFTVEMTRLMGHGPDPSLMEELKRTPLPDGCSREHLVCGHPLETNLRNSSGETPRGA